MNLKGKKILSANDLGNGDYQLTIEGDLTVIAHIIPITSVESKETEDEDGEKADLTLGDLQSMDLSELKELCEEHGLKFKKKASEDDLIELLQEALDIPNEDDEESDDDDSNDDTPTLEDLEGMDIDELKELCDENGLEYKKKASEEDLVEILKEHFEISEDEDDEESDDDDDQSDISFEDLQEMDIEELRELCEENDVEFKKKDSEDVLRKKFAEAFDLEIPKAKKK